jgi:hypothetical protein
MLVQELGLGFVDSKLDGASYRQPLLLADEVRDSVERMHVCEF